MSTPTRLPQTAGRRIRGFTTAVWVIGVLVVLIAIFFSLRAQAVESRYARYAPWDRPVPVAAQHDESNGRWSSDVGAYIELAYDGPVEALLLTNDMVHLDLSSEQSEVARDNVAPQLIGNLSSSQPRALLLSQAGARLWVSAGGPWAVSLSGVDVVEIGDQFEGSGDALLWYRGAASSGTISQFGTGQFELELISLGSEPRRMTAIDASTLPIDWAGSEGVLIRVHSSEKSASWVFATQRGAETALQQISEVKE